MAGRKRFPHVLVACALLFGISGAVDVACAQNLDYWRPILHAEALLDTQRSEILHFSSFAQNGGNSDQGNYSGTDPFGWSILCAANGPGVVSEFWCTLSPMPSSARLRIFVDDTVHAVIDTPVVSFFGYTSPFMPPLADSSSGGLYSYVPIPFQSRLRISYSGPALYYHVSITALSAGTTIQSFTLPPQSGYLLRLDSLRARAVNPLQPAWANRSFAVIAGTATLSAGQTQVLVERYGSGGCRRLFVRITNHTQGTLDNVWLRIYTDHNPVPDVEGPLSALFGTTQGWISYRSAFTGIKGDSLYLNLPTGYRSNLRVDVENRTTLAQTVRVIAETVSLLPWEVPPLKLHSIFSEANCTVRWEGHSIADVQGPGNYLGMLFDEESQDAHVLEGDETICVDGEEEPSWRGTGTEDYFNGGYYWNDGTSYAALAFHGCIRFWGYAAAAYRWHITDPVPFSTRFRMNIEVGGWNELTAHYRTMAFLCLPRERWHVADRDGDHQTTPGEQLRIVGLGLTPHAAVQRVSLGNAVLQQVAGDTQVDGDSVLDVTVLAPSDGTNGLLPLRMMLDSSHETVDSAWQHSGEPLLSFRPRRMDIDTCVYAGDTLDMLVQGLAQGTGASIYADEVSLPWIAVAPAADSTGHLQSAVQIPSGLMIGDHALRAIISGLPDAVASEPLKVRPFVRFELEELTVVSRQCVYEATSYVPDWVLPNSDEPWGRDLAADIMGNGAGDFVEFTFSVPMRGTFQPQYFFGRTNSGALIQTAIDDSADLEGYDSCLPSVGWRWSRSDTVRGVARTLGAGMHTVRFQISGRNPQSVGWRMILDQMLLSEVMEQTESVVPHPVRDLVIAPDSGGVRLIWSPVREDLNGNLITPAAYSVYRTISRLDSLPVFLAELSGTDTTFLDSFVDSTGVVVSYLVTVCLGDCGGRTMSAKAQRVASDAIRHGQAR